VGTSPWSDYESKQKIHARLDWKYWGWNLMASYNKTGFYDLFGPTRRSRAGYTFGLTYRKNILFAQTTYIKASIFGIHLITDVNNAENVRNIFNFGL
jgi:hypothetical protein